MTVSSGEPDARPRGRGGLAPTVGRWLVLIGLPWAVGRLLVAVSYLVVRVGVDELGVDRPFQLTEGLLAWDGGWYREIAEGGYDRVGVEGVRFFPLFPLVGRLLSPLTLGSEGAALVLVANLASVAVLVLLHRLVLEHTGDDVLARRAVWVMALFPSAFVFTWAYSESLMLVGVLAAALAARRDRWGQAAAWAVVAATSRPLGAAVALILVADAWPGWRSADLAGRAQRALAVVAGPLAAGGYVLWASTTYEEWLAPFTVQDDLRTSANPVVRIFDGLGELFTDSLGDGLHVPFALGFVVLFVLGLGRWPVGWSAYAGAVLLASLSADNLNSLERYGLNAFPLVLTLAWVTTRWRWTETPVVATAAATAVALCSLAWFGAYVP